MYQEEDPYDYLFKILLIGDAAVGKSSLLLRYTDNKFPDNYMATIGIDFRIKSFTLDGKIIKLQIWDTAGQDRFKNIIKQYYKGAHGVIFVYDVNDPASFDNLEEWNFMVKEHAPDNIKKALFGKDFMSNKIDLERKVKYQDAKAYADNLKMNYVETSAKSGENVDSAFLGFAKQLKQDHDLVKTTKKVNTKKQLQTKLMGKQKKIKTGCC